MKAPWWTWLLILLFVPALFIAPLFRGKIEKKREILPFDPVCFLSGDVKQSSAPGDTSFGALGGMVRLRMDAVTAEECKIEFEAYCRTLTRERPTSQRHLKGYFQDQNQRKNFVITESCQILEQKEEAAPR